MARIIFTSRYLKNAPGKQIKNLVNYMATRPGVEGFKSTLKPVTEKQKDFISEQIKVQPEIKDSFEYEDYIASPTLSNASELISAIAEKYVADPMGLKNYVDYIAKRPRAERSAVGHGLWSSTNEEISLQKTAEEVANHKGNIYTHVISLRREDAERLGFDNASAWRNLVKSKLPIIAKSMNIPMSDLNWYGAFHDEGNHPHAHLLVYSKDPKKGYLSKNGIETMRSAFGTAIFKDDLLHIYEQKDEARKLLQDTANEKVKKIIENMKDSEFSSPVMEELLLKLSEELKKVKGKTDYGWLKGTPKLLVDNIATELSKDKDIAELYKQWCDCKDETAKTYRKNPLKHRSLADEEEFRSIKNMVIQYAKKIEEPLAEHLMACLNQPNCTSAQAVSSLLRAISSMIAQDYENQQKKMQMTDKKLLKKIMQKKEALGQKQTFE